MITAENTNVLRRSQLSDVKKVLLEKKMRGLALGAPAAPTILRRSDAGNPPLSFAQLSLWFCQQLEPASPLYNVGMTFRLAGPLNREALRRALEAIVARHQILRTRFVAQEDYPVQIIDPPSAFSLTVTSLGPLPEAELAAEVQALCAKEAKRPFDLTRDPMLRAQLVRLGETEHILQLTIHHIASDAWSLGVLFRDLGALYNAGSDGRSAALPELPVQYADFAIWQRNWLQAELLEKMLVFWKQQLSNAPSFLDLPTDRPRPAAQTFRGRCQRLVLPAALNEALNALSRAEGATLFMTLLAAFQTLLCRYTRQCDILVGTPLAGRTHKETEDLIGFFVNTLVLRTDLSGNPPFRELLRRVREVTLDAYAGQNLPFEKLVEALRPERSAHHAPFVQVMFVLQNAPVHNLELAGLTVTPVEVDTNTAKFDLTLAVEERASGFGAVLEYNCDLFDDATVCRMLKHYQTLLEGIVADPGQRLADLPLLTPAERHQVLSAWNDTGTDFPRDKTIPQLFEEQAQRTPEAIAVAFQNQRLTYRELHERGNQLARALQDRGVGSDTMVAVCMERSLELIVALLGILKAGGAYVSLDPSYPKERLTFMIEEAQAPVVLTQEALRTRCPAPMAQGAVLCLDSDWAALARESAVTPDSRATAESLAYVSFTSGSTGRPKGVCVPHRGVVRLVRSTDYARLTADEVFLQMAPIAFDASTLEIWGPLLNGGRLVVLPPGTPSLAELGEAIRKNGITSLWLTAGLFSQMVEEELDSLQNVRQLLAGGDVLSVPHVQKALARLKGCQLINGYGPTENTTFTCCYRIPATHPIERSIPIGRPIANTQVYVLDEHMQPVPVGVPGELLVGGEGLARGYLNRPELTAEKFVRNPFSDKPGARLYKTGDLVRWLPDGNIEFLGRIDLQVKIRGFRVELGEVEAALAQHSAVQECVVLADPGTPGEKRLLGYVVARPGPALPASELREFLRQKLPEYMVPSQFLFLAALPLSPNGKVDRQALVALNKPSPVSQRDFVPPQDIVERRLVEIWESVLGIHPIGVEDPFFELGGHSLLAVRLVAQIEKVFGKKIPVAAVFQSPTVAQLAQVLREEREAVSDFSVVPIQAHGTKPPLFFVHGVGGGMFWGYTNLSRCLGPDQPVYGFKSRGMAGWPEWNRIEEMAAQYVADLRAVRPRGPYHLGGYCFGGNVAYEMARVLHAQGEPVALLALMDCAPLNSSYDRIRCTPAWLLKFLRNLGYWVGCFFQWNARQRNDFIRWKMRTLHKRMARLLAGSRHGSSGIEVDELVDLSAKPAEERRLWAAHVRALFNYHPQPYEGRVTLFRTRGHQLFCSYDPQFGWGELARGGVTVKVVPGAHESILEEPHVSVLAEELRRVLQNIGADESKIEVL